MVQLHMKIGTLDLAKHIKEIKVRAHVVLRLGYHLIRAGHATDVKSGGSEHMRAARKALRERVRQRYPSLGTAADDDGVVPPAVLRKIEEIQKNKMQASTLMQDKHATPAEAGSRFDEVFQGMHAPTVIN